MNRHGQLLTHLRFLAEGAGAGGFLDVRWGRPQLPMRKRLLPAEEIDFAALLIEAHVPYCDVYLGACMRRDARFGGAAAISAAMVLFADCDREDAQERLALFACPPTLEVASGSPGHIHAYWQLIAPAQPDEVEQANVRLAWHLGADRTCADLARVLRPAGTLNHKHRPPLPVELHAHRPGVRYRLGELMAALPESPLRLPRSRPEGKFARRRGQLEQALCEIPASVYVPALTGRKPDRAGKVLCPLHVEENASLQLYPDGTFYCFGCRRGGSVIDFAAHLWGLVARDAGFAEILDRLSARLLSGPEGASGRDPAQGGPRAPGAQPARPRFSRP